MGEKITIISAEKISHERDEGFGDCIKSAKVEQFVGWSVSDIDTYITIFECP